MHTSTHQTTRASKKIRWRRNWWLIEVSLHDTLKDDSDPFEIVPEEDLVDFHAIDSVNVDELTNYMVEENQLKNSLIIKDQPIEDSHLLPLMVKIEYTFHNTYDPDMMMHLDTQIEWSIVITYTCGPSNLIQSLYPMVRLCGGITMSL